MPLGPDGHIYLTAAQGFVGLKMYVDSDAEQDRIDPLLPPFEDVQAVWDLL